RIGRNRTEAHGGVRTAGEDRLMAFKVAPSANLEEFGQAVFAIGQYFGMEPTEERMERFAKNLPIERMHAARENGTIVGGAGAFPFELSVPGAVVPTAGVTVVGTFPTHRRRGVLRAMMRAQLDDVHARAGRRAGAPRSCGGGSRSRCCGRRKTRSTAGSDTGWRRSAPRSRSPGST